MALPKVCGIETEYGIVVRGAENNPVSASSLLINAYVSATSVTFQFKPLQPGTYSVNVRNGTTFSTTPRTLTIT